MAEQTWLAVGLGNPGRRYEHTRHNAGTRAIGRLAKALSVKLKRSRSPALVGEARLEEGRLILATPTTFMNESGIAIASLLSWHQLPTDSLVVIHDEIDIGAGTIRLKRGGGTAGHNGLESVARSLSTKDFYRVRVGVGRPPGRRDAANWVLDRMSRGECEEAAVTEAEAGEALLMLIREGIDKAMSIFHAR